MTRRIIKLEFFCINCIQIIKLKCKIINCKKLSVYLECSDIQLILSMLVLKASFMISTIISTSWITFLLDSTVLSRTYIAVITWGKINIFLFWTFFNQRKRPTRHCKLIWKCCILGKYFRIHLIHASCWNITNHFTLLFKNCTPKNLSLVSKNSKVFLYNPALQLNYHQINSKVFLYNTALSAQLPCLAGLSLQVRSLYIYPRRIKLNRLWNLFYRTVTVRV